MAPAPEDNTTVRHDLVLRWLDHQLIGPDKALVGNVDDLELIEEAGEWWVTGVMSGPASLSGRFPGRLGSWLGAVWRRLDQSGNPGPVVVPIEHVTRVGSDIELDPGAARELAATFALERWLRRFVISRIPGATGGDGSEAAGAASPGSVEGAAGSTSRATGQSRIRGPLAGSTTVSAVIGRHVVGQDRRDLGRVCELRCLGRPHERVQVPIRLTHLQYTSHVVASGLGYGADRDQGPLLVNLMLRWWHRHDRLLDIDDLKGRGLREAPLVVTSPEHHQHPHAVA